MKSEWIDLSKISSPSQELRGQSTNCGRQRKAYNSFYKRVSQPSYSSVHFQITEHCPPSHYKQHPKALVYRGTAQLQLQARILRSAFLWKKKLRFTRSYKLIIQGELVFILLNMRICIYIICTDTFERDSVYLKLLFNDYTLIWFRKFALVTWHICSHVAEMWHDAQWNSYD